MSENPFRTNQKEEPKSSKSNEPSLPRLTAIIRDLKPGSETVRKVTLLEESCECIIPWLKQVDLPLRKKFLSEVASTLRKHYDSDDLPATATVRLLKAGLRLVTLISSVSLELNGALLDNGILQKLLYLISLKHFASSLKIMALHGIDQIISWPNGLASFLRFQEADLEKGISGRSGLVKKAKNSKIIIMIKIQPLNSTIDFRYRLSVKTSVAIVCFLTFYICCINCL